MHNWKVPEDIEIPSLKKRFIFVCLSLKLTYYMFVTTVRNMLCSLTINQPGVMCLSELKHLFLATTLLKQYY